MDVQAQVAGQITSSPTRNGGTKFDVPLSNGMKVTTFDVATATKASNAGAQVATFRIEEKPNPRGGPPYRNLIAVALPGEQLPPEIPGAGTPLGATFSGPQPTGIVPAATSGSSNGYRGGGGGGGGMSLEDKVRVTKLSCISSAATTFAGSGDIDAVLEAARKVFSEVMSRGVPESVANDLDAISVAQHNPQAVAAYVAAEAGAAAVQVGAANVPAPVAAEPAAALPWTA